MHTTVRVAHILNNQLLRYIHVHVYTMHTLYVYLKWLKGSEIEVAPGDKITSLEQLVNKMYINNHVHA